MPVSALIGCQWGDEGKGKIVDILSARVGLVARYQGGANAGHTVVIGEETYILHLLPVGILRPGVTCVLGNGMVIDLDSLEEELEAIHSCRIDTAGRLFISPRAHLVLSYHKAVEKQRELSASKPIGTTLRGIGPAYETKAARIGLRVGDLYRPQDLMARVESLHDWAATTGAPRDELASPRGLAASLAPHAEKLRPFVRDVRITVQEALSHGSELLLEGAQGTLLDLDHGTYPFVTSSSTSVGGTVSGLAIPPTSVTRAIGVTKAYTTRVGEGPFPTQFDEAFAEPFRTRAAEFGATTGRPRRCGWLDGVLLRYAAEVNGLTALVVTKLDVLDGMETLKIATSYASASGDSIDPNEVDVLAELDQCRPVYEELPGWTEPTTGATRVEDLPANARAYLKRVSEIAGVPIAMVSTGHRRDQIVVVNDELLPARAAVR